MEWTLDNVRFIARKWDERVMSEVSRFDTLVPEIAERGTVLREPATTQTQVSANGRPSA